jgi:hypothetical protein
MICPYAVPLDQTKGWYFCQLYQVTVDYEGECNDTIIPHDVCLLFKSAFLPFNHPDNTTPRMVPYDPWLGYNYVAAFNTFRQLEWML